MKQVLSALVLSCIGLGSVHAQAPYPSKTITIVVPYAAGGLSDSLARALGQRLSTNLKQQVIIENKGGGNTVIGASAVAKAPADGYTLLLTAEATLAMNPHLYAKLAYQPETSFAPVAALVNLPQAMAVSGSSTVKTLAGLIAKAKGNPGKTTYATLGTGSTAHLNMELFQQTTGITMLSVPYKGASPALTDLMGGHVEAMVVATGLAAQYANAGKLRLLAVAGAKRSPLAPDVPTFTEAGMPAFAPASWFALLAVAGTPPEIVKQLNTAVTTILMDPVFKTEYLDKNGMEPIGGPSEQLAALIKSESLRWGNVIRVASIKLD